MRVSVEDFNIETFEYENLTMFTLKKIHYIFVPFSFDIETTSFIQDDKKLATMYVWQVGIGKNTCIIGRTWEQFILLMHSISKHFNLSKNLRLICWVHNLAYEFQWIRKLFEWEHIFAREKYKPILATTTIGIEFRCSYILSGYSLSKLAENYTKTQKLKGGTDLDYHLIRHSKTLLTKTELNYCENDVQILLEYAEYLFKEYIYGKTKTTLPLTQTSVVRNYCRKKLKQFTNNKITFDKYHRALKHCAIIDDKLYKAIKNAYMGGYTHACYLHINEKLENCDMHSLDFTSSYPASMLDYYPMGKFIHITQPTQQKFNDFLATKCCLIHVVFYNVTPKKHNHILSISKAIYIEYGENDYEDNGRVTSCKKCEYWLTELDYDIVKKFYHCDYIDVIEMYVATRGYLPKFLVHSMRDFYLGKTKLKGVKGKELEYLHSKEMLNSIYGMCVYDVVSLIISYKEEEWESEEPDTEEKLLENSKSLSQFLLYQWGVYVSAHSRYNLLSCVAQFDDDSDVAYCDTDSIKCIDYQKNKHIFDNYNKENQKKIKQSCDYFNIDYNDLKGIGDWDNEGHIKQFKTLGAKKYVTDKSITVSGLNKEKAKDYITNVLKQDLVDTFDTGLEFPCGYSGRSTLQYFDEPFTTLLTDYNGITAPVTEQTYIYMEETTYNLGISQAFYDYLFTQGVRKK